MQNPNDNAPRTSVGEVIQDLITGDGRKFITSAFEERRCYGLEVIRPGYPCPGCNDCRPAHQPATQQEASDAKQQPAAQQEGEV